MGDAWTGNDFGGNAFNMRWLGRTLLDETETLGKSSRENMSEMNDACSGHEDGSDLTVRERV